jgi:uncharacterized protein YpbB
MSRVKDGWTRGDYFQFGLIFIKKSKQNLFKLAGFGLVF